MEPFESHQSLLAIDIWNKLDKNIVAGITTRNGGISQKPYDSMNMGLHVNDSIVDVIKNRHQLAENVDFSLESWVCAEQVHGNKVLKVTKEDKGKGTLEMATAIKAVDGIYTKEPNILLTACYADCVPLYFFAPNYGVIGIAHAGWRGTVGDIAGEMVNAWSKNENIPKHEIYACIGPSIGKCCYVVDDFVIEQVKNTLHYDTSTLADVYHERSKGQYELDLKHLNYVLLKNAGILTKNIEISTYCTSCRSDLFFSHRRDLGKTGRLMSYIGMKG
ncbi:peptidoglycan editing factor PgeF [Bacillus sp. Marseille-P3661]|uniref:peptidoglycan editing factor PgeF n=1 Tax=Bacillus sp. Marseille-P3661 TaxID=1936234 RepID=UPI000C81B6D1|nr:peptidoglycan editing factor PgeF [Bacillus sp. Marseille-P3661]